jgi:glycosyltransferase involved in cell wall biosynthesis
LTPFLAIDTRLSDHTGSSLRLVSVGDLVPYKGHRQLLEALALVNESFGERFEVAIVGDGPLKAGLLSQAESLGLSNTLQLVGSMRSNEVPGALANGDVFVFPSLSEPWGLALVEAMAAGLPVVASSSAGATRDLVIQGAGTVVDPTDVQEFAAALTWMMELSPTERYDIGQRARAHVAALCSLENSAAGFVEGIRQSLMAEPD